VSSMWALLNATGGFFFFFLSFFCFRIFTSSDIPFFFLYCRGACGFSGLGPQVADTVLTPLSPLIQLTCFLRAPYAYRTSRVLPVCSLPYMVTLTYVSRSFFFQRQRPCRQVKKKKQSVMPDRRPHRRCPPGLD
jgi:hypothetical protein